jgi:hypothetical protein
MCWRVTDPKPKASPARAAPQRPLLRRRPGPAPAPGSARPPPRPLPVRPGWGEPGPGGPRPPRRPGSRWRPGTPAHRCRRRPTHAGGWGAGRPARRRQRPPAAVRAPAARPARRPGPRRPRPERPTPARRAETLAEPQGRGSDGIEQGRVVGHIHPAGLPVGRAQRHPAGGQRRGQRGQPAVEDRRRVPDVVQLVGRQVRPDGQRLQTGKGKERQNGAGHAQPDRTAFPGLEIAVHRRTVRPPGALLRPPPPAARRIDAPFIGPSHQVPARARLRPSGCVVGGGSAKVPRWVAAGTSARGPDPTWSGCCRGWPPPSAWAGYPAGRRAHQPHPEQLGGLRCSTR